MDSRAKERPVRLNGYDRQLLVTLVDAAIEHGLPTVHDEYAPTFEELDQLREKLCDREAGVR